MKDLFRGGSMSRSAQVGRLGILLVAGSMGACASEGSDEGVVARVGPYTLTVDAAVDLLADEERLAADAGVVESLARLWMDYVLLAEAAARDTTFGELDFRPLVMQQVDQMMVLQLRDSVIQVDTFVTDDELRARYDEEAPQMEVRARHIMLQLPAGATRAQQDSVRSALADVRERLLAGESFEELAGRLSHDRGTAPAGGDLGYFQRGDMVAPFEEAAFSLEPGEISEVVRTPMGFHLIRVDDQRVRGFDEVATQFRASVQDRLVQEAESLFVAGLVERTEPRMVEGAPDIVREVALNPGARVSSRAARRPLVEWETGAVRLADVRQILQIESPALRSQMANGSDQEVEDFLQSLARRDLLVREAEAAGLRPARDSVEALVDDAREQLRRAARRLGLLHPDRAPGERLEVAVTRAAHEALTDNLSGATQVLPLGLVGFQLREGRSSTVRDAGVGEVIFGVARVRAGRGPSPEEMGLGTPTGPGAPPAPDSAGN